MVLKQNIKYGRDSKPASSLEMQIFRWHFSENASFIVQSVVNTKLSQFGGNDVSDVFFHSFKANLLIRI